MIKVPNESCILEHSKKIHINGVYLVQNITIRSWSYAVMSPILSPKWPQTWHLAIAYAWKPRWALRASPNSLRRLAESYSGLVLIAEDTYEAWPNLCYLADASAPKLRRSQPRSFAKEASSAILWCTRRYALQTWIHRIFNVKQAIEGATLDDSNWICILM